MFKHPTYSSPGGPQGDDENVPAKIYEQPELKQPDQQTLILEAHIHANPKPKVTWLCNGDFIKESDTKYAHILGIIIQDISILSLEHLVLSPDRENRTNGMPS